MFAGEPLAADSPLRDLDDVLLTPHAAWYSPEALADLPVHAAENIIRYLAGESVPIVNPTSSPLRADGRNTMELLRLGPVGHERPYAREAGITYDLSPLTAEIDGAFLATDGIDRVREALGRGELPAATVDGLRIGAPVARPTAVICIGQNYAAHAAESGSVPPEHPVVFFKHPNTVVGPDDVVLLPPGAEKVDWEVEMAVVIGKTARYLSSPDAAREVIAGYTISNDVSERAYQLDVSGGQWSKGKCSETFNPLGRRSSPPTRSTRRRCGCGRS